MRSSPPSSTPIAQGGDPYEALRQAVLFASWKIGVAGAGEGFLSAGERAALYAALESGR